MPRARHSDAALLERHFEAFAASGSVPAPAARREPHSPVGMDRDFFSRALQADVQSADLVSRSSEHSIVSELTAWRSGRPTGLYSTDFGSGPRRRHRQNQAAGPRDAGRR
jgi:hypothetical protein